jgi:hypothetical protein
LTEFTYPENSFVNSIEYKLFYGTDGFLYAEHKFNGDYYVLLNGQWEELNAAYELMQSVQEDFLNFNLDGHEFISDD